MLVDKLVFLYWVYRDSVVLALCVLLAVVHAFRSLWHLVAVYGCLLLAALGSRRKPLLACIFGLGVSLAALGSCWRDVLDGNWTATLPIHAIPLAFFSLCMYIYRTQEEFQQDLNNLESLRYKLKTV